MTTTTPTTERRKRQYRWLVIPLALLLLLLLSRCVYDGRITTESTHSGAGVTTGQVSPVSMSGTVTRALKPGTFARINIVLDNRGAQPADLSRLNVRIADVAAPRADSTHPCSASDFAVRQASDAVAVQLPRGSTTSLRALGIPAGQWPMIGMRDLPRNQDGCQGATVKLRYSAEGATT